MTDRLMDPDDPRPVYLRIADELRHAYEPGAQLPSVPKVAEQWGVARETVRSAIDVLRNEGLIVSWQGRGTFYRTRPADDADNAGIPTDPVILQQLDAIMSRLDLLEARLARVESARDS
ncbi:GntR family transcriptional regulator [Nocardia sp. BMG111209]|uniref:GntR family transcriptional regulator n=1 Tax=Nocardia sp. BMG111209 TaxID=1160137 RepID=UPI00039A5EB9|nr:GntR family transcriptional regulator [Nocardia sp. BMG111209]